MNKNFDKKDIRISFDEKNGAVRSFFGTDIYSNFKQVKLSGNPRKAAESFLEANKEDFKFEDISYKYIGLREGSSVKTADFIQEIDGIPVYNSQISVSIRNTNSTVSSMMNKVDYSVEEFKSSGKKLLSEPEIIDSIKKSMGVKFKHIEFNKPVLYHYRHVPIQLNHPPKGDYSLLNEIHSLGKGSKGQVYLAWQVMADTDNPVGAWEILVNAENGEIIAVKNRVYYASVKARVFWPDPIRSSRNDSLSWSTPESDLNGQMVEVSLENLDGASQGVYKLNGTWVKSSDFSSPEHIPAQTSGNFIYGAKDQNFLDVMAYYYLDRFIESVRTYDVNTFNNGVSNYPITVDAVGRSDDNSSCSAVTGGGSKLRFGLGGVPDASDPGVILHEMGHALHNYLGSKHHGYEEGFNDFMAAAWLDRYNENQFQREEVMPWDQHYNGTNHWGTTRRVNIPHRFDDQNFSNYDFYLKGNVLATALWDVFLNIGGISSDASIRKKSADTVIHMYMEMLTRVISDSSDSIQHARDLINALIVTDEDMTGGLHKKVIWNAFRRRGLWPEFTPKGNVDLYIRDSEADNGEQSTHDIHWTSPDIWVRNNPPSDPSDPGITDNPEQGHQSPINDQPNYLYVRVHNRGSQEAPANTFTVEVFHCDPGTGMIWPNHFNSMGSLYITESIPAGGSVRVGPFVWTPSITNHECLLAAVDGPMDPTITRTVTGAVDHWKIVKYDNNIGQRNVSPYNAVPGGKIKTSFVIRGTTKQSINSLVIDSKAFPDDTKFTLRFSNKISDGTKGKENVDLISRTSLYSTYTLMGSKIGKLIEFPMKASEESVISLIIDFSNKAKHLERYPLIISQYQDGIVAGRVTIDVKAFKETEDYIYGNSVSLEMHRHGCTFLNRMRQYHKRVFETIEEGKLRGYNGCAYCMKEEDTD